MHPQTACCQLSVVFCTISQLCCCKISLLALHSHICWVVSVTVSIKQGVQIWKWHGCFIANVTFLLVDSVTLSECSRKCSGKLADGLHAANGCISAANQSITFRSSAVFFCMQAWTHNVQCMIQLQSSETSHDMGMQGHEG